MVAPHFFKKKGNNMKSFEINGITYKAAEFDFNLTCEIEEKGMSLADIRKKPMSFLRTYVALSGDMDVDIAGKEIEAHIMNGGTLDAVMDVMLAQLEDSGFFRKLFGEEPATETTRKKTTSAKSSTKTSETK